MGDKEKEAEAKTEDVAAEEVTEEHKVAGEEAVAGGQVYELGMDEGVPPDAVMDEPAEEAAAEEAAAEEEKAEEEEK